MCGLTGFIAPAASSEDLSRDVRRMRDALVHRGPDDAGEWIDADAGVALGFRRLSILDLSAAGHQPMVSRSGRYVATLNGEIYNFEELRRELDGAWRGHSDTEVMLAAFDAWGVEAALQKFIGMFAIALWDRTSRRLMLIRDRMGVKPLYYGLAGSTFMYASELKALRQHPHFEGRIDRGALHLYLRYLYVPAPWSIYEGISKLMPGTMLTFDPSTRTIVTTTYWSAREAALRGVADRFEGTEEEASHELETLLRDAVRLRMVSDVPTGVFLSGGVDSSLVAALMQAQSDAPVRTFAMGFTDASYDEAPFAAAVARHLGTNHTEMYVTPEDAMNVIPKLPAMYDEPFGDSSQIPTHLVAQLARQHVTVALSGDGGDELFGGYNRYFVGQTFLQRVAALPRSMRPAVGRTLTAIAPRAWHRVHKVARVLASDDRDAMYFELMSHWSDVVIGGSEHPIPLTDRESWPPLGDPIERMMYFDQLSYLPDDILTKVDRASMAVSVEVREPLLDHRLVEFAWRLPLAMKVRGAKGKHVLRRVLDRYIPRPLIERPKMGFGMPLDAWLRGPLRDWAESLLDESTMRAQGWLNPKPIRAKWEEHINGNGDWKHYLWALLMLQSWLSNERAASTSSADTPGSNERSASPIAGSSRDAG
jgi:asparagine synthase (glutamine-hydrolysing)